MDHRVFRIVLTGAPASGKTVFFDRLKTLPRFQDFVFFEETARLLLNENPGWREKWPEFHKEIYRRQVAQENALAGRSFITDRGTVDAFAFHPETMTEVGTTLEMEYARYDGAVQLGSAAALGEAFYVRDEIRNESISDVLYIEDRITSVWKEHPGYRFLPAQQEPETKFQSLVTLLTELTNPD